MGQCTARRYLSFHHLTVYNLLHTLTPHLAVCTFLFADGPRYDLEPSSRSDRKRDLTTTICLLRTTLSF